MKLSAAAADAAASHASVRSPAKAAASAPAAGTAVLASPQLMPPTPVASSLFVSSPHSQQQEGGVASPGTPVLPQPREAALLRTAVHNQADGKLRAFQQRKVRTRPAAASPKVSTPSASGPVPLRRVGVVRTQRNQSPQLLLPRGVHAIKARPQQSPLVHEKENTPEKVAHTPVSKKKEDTSLEALATRLANMVGSERLDVDAVLPHVHIPDLTLPAGLLVEPHAAHEEEEGVLETAEDGVYAVFKPSLKRGSDQAFYRKSDVVGPF